MSASNDLTQPTPPFEKVRRTVPDEPDEQSRQYRRLCEAVGFRVGQHPAAKVYRQAAERIADLTELRLLYRRRDALDAEVWQLSRVIWFCAGVFVGTAAVLIETFMRGSL